MADFSLADQIRCVEREIAMRERVYPKWVAAGRMKLDQSEREIDAMKAVLATVKAAGALVANRASSDPKWLMAVFDAVGLPRDA